ncbi:MAG: SDR family NAD(P)-dependent oxidoreductase [Solirubrobacteraceae bacterium]
MVLAGRQALVTGAGRGIGRACALALAEAGADVALVARSAGELDQVAREVQERGRRARVVAADLCREQDLGRVAGVVDDTSILVNAAGTNIPERFVDVTAEHLDRILDLNLRATFLVTREVVRQMLAAGRAGSITTISSQMGHVGYPGRTAYCASKHAVEGLTKALAVELAPQRIRVNSVAPTFVETPLTRPLLADDAFRADVLSRIPLGQLGEPRDVAAAVVFLASEEARMITGTSLRVDGGWTAI